MDKRNDLKASFGLYKYFKGVELLTLERFLINEDRHQRIQLGFVIVAPKSLVECGLLIITIHYPLWPH